MSDRRLGRKRKKQKNKKLLEDGGGKKGAQKKKGKKKTFDRLLESKPRDKFESLEMHLFFFREREMEEKNVSKPLHPKTVHYQSIPSSDVNTQSVN